MAEVVYLVVRMLTPVIIEQVKQVSRVGSEVEYIRDELERIEKFLEETDATEDSDQQLQVWVRKVRVIAYDTEDVLDKFALPMAHRCREGFCLYRCHISCKIQSINRRVRDSAAGYRRYTEWRTNGSSASSNTQNDDEGHALRIGEEDLVDIVERKRCLTDLLLDGGLGLKVVSVSGMAGSGKTALVKRVYEDMILRQSFEHYIWLTVSKSRKMEEVLKDMIQQLYRTAVPQGLETMTINQQKMSIDNFLQNKKYLVVFDDVSSITRWEEVKTALPPHNNRRSRVMLTTRVGVAIATDVVDHSLMLLSPEDSWTLFRKKAFGGNPCTQHLEETCRDILKRCDGLPLAIEAIADILARKPNITTQELGRLTRNILVESADYPQVARMKRRLSLNYHDLPYHLKVCFLYLSIFPKNHDIKRTRLIRLWTAEGFVQDEGEKPKEEVAEDYLKDLINRSMIQVEKEAKDGRVDECRIHDIWRELITLKSKEQKIAAIAGTDCPSDVRRLAFHNTSVNGNVPKRMRLSKLRSLFMFGVPDSFFNSSMHNFLKGDLRLVKVLDLTDALMETLPDEVFKLFHLRYLSLRGTKVKSIPDLIGNLENLETLDLKHTYVTELPIGILKLKKLRHLLVYRRETNITEGGGYQTIHGFKVPTEIGSLSSLHQLCYIDASLDQVGGTTVRKLGSLTQLRRLGIVKLRSVDETALPSSIERLTNLHSLAIRSITGEMIPGIQSVSPGPLFLKRLSLSGRLDNLPGWISSLNDLVKLYLGHSDLKDDPMQSLGGLPNLVHIEFHRAYRGKDLCFSGGGFGKLNTLRLTEFTHLERVIVEQGTMAQLERLHINNCEAVLVVPSGIQHLQNLKFFEFLGVSPALGRSLDRQTGNDYWKISHIPNCWIHIRRNRLVRRGNIGEERAGRSPHQVGIIITTAVIFHLLIYWFLFSYLCLGG